MDDGCDVRVGRSKMYNRKVSIHLRFILRQILVLILREIDSASIAPFPSWPDGLKRKKRHENANRYAFTIRYYAMSFRVARIDMMIHSVFRSARPLLSMIKIISPAPR